jgi:hypothetical protein
MAPLQENIRRVQGLTPMQREAVAPDLYREIEGEVRLYWYAHLLYATDASSYPMEAVRVVTPPTANEVEAALPVLGYKQELAEASCYGMASAFGFEREHYEMSQAIGTLKLFHAVETTSDKQVGHFTSPQPPHVAEFPSDPLRTGE